MLEGENMNQSDAQTEPNYVTCPCQHCGGNIEFDANQLDATEIPTVPCPHCELQTTIFVPEQKVPPVIKTPPVSLDEDFGLSAKIEATKEEKARQREIYELARGHFFGDGVEQDLVEAYKWIYMGNFSEVISEEESAELDTISNYLADKLTPAQIREAHTRAALIGQDSDNSNRQSRQAISTKVRQEVWRRDGGACVKCGSRVNLEYDHIVPVSKGGSNTARNIELLCEACNRSKSASIQ